MENIVDPEQMRISSVFKKTYAKLVNCSTLPQFANSVVLMDTLIVIDS